jgi:hypothetical protein
MGALRKERGVGVEPTMILFAETNLKCLVGPGYSVSLAAALP